jgi:DNA-directed RNA polymerase specialized sigma24 family protein
LQIRDFTQTEADYLETVCNFTPDENCLFQLRLKDTSLEDCAERMQTSVPTINRLHKRVLAKIEREL